MSAAKRHRAYTASSDGAVTRRSKRKIAYCSSSLYAHINILPIDVLSLILSYVPLRPRLLCVAAVCRRWRDGTYRSVRAIKWTPSGPGVAETLHQRFPFLRDLCVEEYKGRGEFKLPERIERVDFAGTCSCGGEFRPLSPCKHMRKSTAEAVVRMSEKSSDSECECLYLTVKPLAHLGVRLDDLFYTAVPLLSASVATLSSLSLAARDVTRLPALHTFFARLHLPLLVRLRILDVADTSLPVVSAILRNHSTQLEDFRLSPPRGEQLCAALGPVCDGLSFPSLQRFGVDGLSHQYPLVSFARLLLGARNLRSLSLLYFTWIPEAEDEMIHFLRTAPLQVRAALTKLVTSSRRMSDFVVQNADLFPGLRLLDGPIWQAPGRAPQVTQRVYTTLETNAEADMWQYLPQYTNLRALHVTSNAFLRGAIDPPPRFRLPHLAKVHLSCTEGNGSLCDTLAFLLDTANAPSLEHVYLHLWFGGSNAEIASIIAHLRRQTRRHRTLLVEVMFALRFGLQEVFDAALASEKANGWIRVKCL